MPARLVAIAAAVVCATGAVYLHQQAGEASRIEAANQAGSQHRYQRVLDEVRSVRQPPYDAEALRLRAYALVRMGHLRPAERAFRAAVSRNPNNWVLRRDWALVLQVLGRRSASRRQILRARMLNPRMPLPPGFVSTAAKSAEPS